MLAPTGTPPRPIGVSRGSDTTGRPIPTIPTPLLEGNDLLTSMVTALSAAAAAITAAAAAADKSEVTATATAAAAIADFIAAYQVTRQQPPATHGRGG
jgi:hypothetical protein